MSHLTGRVRLTGTGAAAQRLGRLVDAAAACVERNIVPRDGRRVLRAGGGYPDPWTRDAAINTWQAAAWLCPDVAADTLRAVCEPDGRTIADDDQWWDQIIWLVGAHQLAMVTGDASWARFGYDVGVATLRRLDERYLGPEGLYRGPAVMADGITGYPPSLHDPGQPDASFALDHAAVRHVRCLSTNATYVWALGCLAELGAVAGIDPAPWSSRAEALAGRVRNAFWIDAEHRFGYLLADGVLDGHQEGLGLALAILSGTATPAQAEVTVAGAVRAPRGLPAVSPHFAGYDDDRPGRHGGALWPMIMGVWAQAVAATGDRQAFGTDLDLLLRLFDGPEPSFREVYHPVTGRPDGGWQTGRNWRSEPDQTWSAATLIGTVLYGLAGLRPAWDGLLCHPCVPPGLGDLELTVHWRGRPVTLSLSETAPSSATVDAAGTVHPSQPSDLNHGDRYFGSAQVQAEPKYLSPPVQDAEAEPKYLSPMVQPEVDHSAQPHVPGGGHA
ncbi:MAG: hypothetical protein J0I14_12690 [Propionibacteriaceae bacterium]|nr:hypothetical protein [Propionibacteriaceae bacterium]